jgi:predicted alpha/beta hydrolase family esterase
MMEREFPDTYHLSIRRNGFGSTWMFGGPNWSRNGGSLTPTQVAAGLAGKRVCILVHGYNVEDPTPAYNSIKENLLEQYDAFIGVHWPGSRVAAAFWLATMRATEAGRKLADALFFVTQDVAALDIEGHSLGCHVTLAALERGMPVRNCILAAAAVDNEALQDGERFAHAIPKAQRIVVCYSENDSVLRDAYKLARWDKALGLTGPEKPSECDQRILPINLSESIKAHGDYKRDRTFFVVWKTFV